MYDRGTSGVITNDSKTFGVKNLKLTIVGRRRIAPNGSSVSTGRINSLYRVSLVDRDNVESRARRGKSLRKVPVELLYLQGDWSQRKYTAYNMLTEEPMSIVFVSSEFVVQHVSSLSIAEAASLLLECVRNMMAHAQKPDFVFRRNGRVHLNRWGCQFSRLLAAEVCA